MQGLIIAFSMYSRIPMPKVDWNEKNMKYAMGFFPLVGMAVGFFFYVSFWILGRIHLGDFLRTGILTALPVLMTGGIHMDGFLDVIDARHSYGDREKKLKILKDPHIGAFAIIYGVIYFILIFGIYSELTRETVGIVAAGFLCSRGFSGFAAVTFQKARKDGMLSSATKDARRKWVRTMNLAAIAGGGGFCLWSQPALTAGAFTAGIWVFLSYKWMAYKEFGGITGDLEGYFLQLFELSWAAGVLLVALFQRAAFWG